MADRVLATKQGTYTDALSPRDANAQLPIRTTENPKVKAAVASKPPQKEKELPLQPPPDVFEPPSSDRRDGAVYRVGKMLGKGGFAVCYEGTLPGQRKKYALKIVKSKMPSKMEQKFQTELQIHSKMRQRNIVQFLRAFSFDNCTYLVLELCPNGSLMEMVKRRKGLTEPEIRFYSVQIAGAIKYMHAKGIIHRDLKMGNIFLDKHMDAKIGDFGLAALLVTGKDMQTIRRTTLCGTPNYIAPEILEKGRKGHDHMVDIWSLGVIMFAMLTSKPPFQSSTTDEIYRRARNRDYEWPQSASQELRDVVATMLEEPHMRPDPDAIVQHDFFVSGHVPLPGEMSAVLRECKPSDERFYSTELTPRLAQQNFNLLKELCIGCEVGPWNQAPTVCKSTWREVALEEKAGLTPIIPLAEGIVYRPYEEVSRELGLTQVPHRPPPQPVTKKEDESTVSQPTQTGLLRAPPQSFAAQQRAQNRPAKQTVTRSRTLEEVPPAAATGTLRQRAKRELLQSSTDNKLGASKTATATITPLDRPNTPVEPPSQPPARRPRAEAQKPASRRPQEEQGPRPNPTDQATGSLFSASERKLLVPDMQPDTVLERLQRLQAELERALNSRSMAIMGKAPTPAPPHIVVKWVDYSNKFGLGYILNDGSVGCVLKSIPGSAKGGKTVTLPPSCILVREAEQHCARRQDPKYPDRHQIVPMSQAVQFYENNGEAGLSTVFVSPRQFKIGLDEQGNPGKIPLGRDIYDFRKREHLILWKKFANYMIAYGRDQDGGADEADEAQMPSSSTKQTMPPADVVTFYQRIGDVGCWVFADGHSQFNFPDHTKIVIDATGTWCHFWHLPQEAAERLATTGELDETALDDRAVLSYPLQTLLNFAAKPSASSSSSAASSSSSSAAASARPSTRASRRRPEISPEVRGVPAANDFRRKIEFIRDLVREWTANGGLGNARMDRRHRMMWRGHRERVRHVNVPVPPAKHVWVTIGARWGDERHAALVDPRRPGVLGEEIESRSGSSSGSSSAASSSQ
ncbi:protein kinase-like domain-containing protein [Xylariomycetidae sp. FL0641]|nr:protein kinase-like domain-containing protein [Xylariomycetidae sp. FL0641]